MALQMTMPDWSRSVAGAALGALAGFFFLYSHLWVLALIVLPLFVVLLLLEGAGTLLLALWSRWRGHPPAPRKPRTDLHWLRRYGLHIGFCLGALVGFVAGQFEVLAMWH